MEREREREREGRGILGLFCLELAEAIFAK